MMAMQHVQATDLTNAPILRLLTEALMRKLGATGVPATGIDKETNLLDVGVVDSQGLLDLIFEVEEGCGRVFDPIRVDFEDGVTLGKLSDAFAY